MEATRWWVFTLLALAFVAAAAATLPPEKARGIAPQDLKYYEAGSSLSCKDKSKSFPLSRLNDDFCDCPDGTDEPGTSACPEGRFYCKNTGDAPKVLFSSSVNDGICDCCDGSDEYDGKVKCANTCWEAGKKAREKLEAKLAMFREGLRLRAADIEKSKQLRKKEESELADLKKDEKSYKPIVDRLKAELDAVEEAERLDRERRDKEEQERRNKTSEASTTDVGQLSKSEDEEEHSEEAVVSVDADEVAVVHEEVEPDNETEEVKPEKEAEEVEPEKEAVATTEEGSDEGEGLSKEELGRLVASRWTGDRDTKEPEAAGPVDDDDDDKDEDEQPYHHEDEEHDENEYDDTYDGYGGGSHDDTGAKEAEKSSWWSSILQSIQMYLGLYKKLHVNLSEAERVRSDYREANSKLSGIRSKISELEEKLKQDFGNEGQFYSLYDRCFEKKQNKYVYKVCPYKRATQEEGHHSTRLGTWSGFKEDHRIMDFSTGDHCWNGPDRSLELRLKCGVANELSEVEEPNRCEYKASFSTPAYCSEERRKKLQAQLDGYSAGTPSHEEL